MNKLINVKGAALAALLSTAALPALAEITLVPQTRAPEMGHVALKSLAEFEAGVSIRLRIDPRTLSKQELKAIVEAIDMRSGDGVAITRGVAIDAEHDIAIGWSGGTAEITALKQTPAGLIVVGSFRDEHGQFVVPPVGSVAAYSLDGRKLCFEQQTIAQAPDVLPMRFSLLIDRSGSMSSVMDGVRRAASTFLETLPESATCSVISFADDQWMQGMQPGEARNCKAADFVLGSLQAGGQTDLYPALSSAYDWLNAPGHEDHQRAAILITDGHVNENTAMKEAVIAAKGDARTFVYFLGDQEESWLAGLADSYLGHEGALEVQLGKYFSVLSGAYSRQTVLRLKDCPNP